MIDENKTTEDLRLELSSLQKKYDQLKQRYDDLILESETTKEDVRRSEMRYHKLAEQIDAIVWRFDLKNDKWVYVSPQTERILGYLPEEWSGFQFWVDIMHPDDQAWAPSFCLTKTKQGTWHEFEYRLRHKNGKDVWIYDKVSVEPVDGEPAYLYGVMFDITQRKHDEKAHQDYALKKLKTAIENTEASVVITDNDGSIEYANPFFTRITGYTPDEYLGQTPRILKSGCHPPEFYEELWHTITSGKTWRGEMCNKAKNGGYFWEFAT
ncbi:MAG: PAS domain-containing protein, partial [Bacteroidota bacterium]